MAGVVLLLVGALLANAGFAQEASPTDLKVASIGRLLANAEARRTQSGLNIVPPVSDASPSALKLDDEVGLRESGATSEGFAAQRIDTVVSPIRNATQPQPVLAEIRVPEALPRSANLEMSAVGSSAPLTSGVLGGRDIACRAAQNWLPADVLRQRGRTLVQLYCDKDECERQAAQALAHFLNLQAKHQEDIGAASALKAYYTRIAIHEQLGLTQESLEYLKREEDKQAEARREGLPAGTDLSSFERHRLEIRDKQLQLRSQDRQLRCLLAQIAKYNYESSQVTQEQLVVVAVDTECERLKQVALRQRNDLAGWAFLACQVNEHSAPIFAKMLGTIIGGWGLPLPRVVGLKAILCPPDYSCLAANMRHELDLTVETHRRWICQAVDEKCAALRLAYDRIEVAQEIVESWGRRIDQLETLDASGESAAEELATARSAVLEAKADVIRRRLDAKLAEIDLAEAVGGISDRCCGGRAWLLTGYE